MKILRIKLLIALLSLSLFANDKSLDSILKDTFVDISVGLSNTPYSKKDLVGNISTSLDENGYLYDLALGYRFNEQIFTTLNYQYSKFKQIDFDDYYITLNYQFKSSLNPYVGILLGQSFMHWNKDPLNSSQNIDWTSGSFMYGVQAGIEYKLSNNISFISKLMYTRINHGTNLISLPAKSYLEHDSKFGILFGVRVWF